MNTLDTLEDHIIIRGAPIKQVCRFYLQQKARLGTTFPPLTNQLICSHLMVSSLETPSSRCLSEPHNAKYEDFGEEPVCTEEMKEEDEDYLFEFDLDSHDSWETEDEEEGGACSGRVGE